jgi:hypothetical protein
MRSTLPGFVFAAFSRKHKTCVESGTLRDKTEIRLADDCVAG